MLRTRPTFAAQVAAGELVHKVVTEHAARSKPPIREALQTLADSVTFGDGSKAQELAEGIDSFLAQPRGPRLCVAAVVTNAVDQVLLVYSRKRRGWELPGGGIEEGETPHEAAIRETREEAGLEVVT